MYFLDDDLSVSGDARHERRVFLMQLLFAETFEEGNQQYLDPELIGETELRLLDEIKSMVSSIDKEIALHAPERPLAEVNKVDLAIMRLIIFESQKEKTPKKVLIDEAVELAKEFGSETSAKFVNGVLGKILFQEDTAMKDEHEKN